MIELSNGEIYVTYLKNNKSSFKRENVMTIIGEPNFRNKPVLALWGSPIDAEYGWKEWCYSNDMFVEDFNWRNPIKWKLKDGSKILKIDLPDVMNEEKSILSKYVIDEPTFGWEKVLDFNLILRDGISAVQLLNPSIGHMFLMGSKLEMMFNTWDCESIVVLNDTKLKFI